MGAGVGGSVAPAEPTAQPDDPKTSADVKTPRVRSAIVTSAGRRIYDPRVSGSTTKLTV
jgi:hypothetical protein